MNVLWLCNVELPLISISLGKAAGCYGGWLNTMARQISEDGHKLTILYPDDVSRSGRTGNIEYSSFAKKESRKVFPSVLMKLMPEIIHIWGTEFIHTSDMVQACREHGLTDKCAISIQGLTSYYAMHYTEGLPQNVIRRFMFRDLLRWDNISRGMKAFEKRGIFEIAAIQNAKHVIGRTDWDEACTYFINRSVRYHFLNETLREPFYHQTWNTEGIRRHSIFTSQCSYPVKGFHYILEAMGYVLRDFPDAHVFTTGINLMNLSMIDKIKLTSYQKYILQLIARYGLEGHITFLGTLSETLMCEQYTKANVFVSASTIENSPNSVGEAMLVGCPVVASDVGGVKNMLTHGMDGYIYQASAPYMLAYYIMKIFRDDSLALDLSKNARNHASLTHSKQVNYDRLMEIYREVAM